MDMRIRKDSVEYFVHYLNNKSNNNWQIKGALDYWIYWNSGWKPIYRHSFWKKFFFYVHYSTECRINVRTIVSCRRNKIKKFTRTKTILCAIQTDAPKKWLGTRCVVWKYYSGPMSYELSGSYRITRKIVISMKSQFQPLGFTWNTVGARALQPRGLK